MSRKRNRNRYTPDVAKVAQSTASVPTGPPAVVQPPPLAVDSTTKSLPIQTIPPIQPVATANPDSVRDALIQFGFAQNPLTQYRQETNFFVRRRMAYEFAMRCPAFTTLTNSVADEIAAQEVFIVPTESSPSASTILQAQEAVTILNHAMQKRDGVLDFIHIFVESYWASKTGAFILTPTTNGRIESIGILNPMLTFPYYGWQSQWNSGGMIQAPVIQPQVDSFGNPITQVEGIWFVDGANYFTLPMGQYHQITPGATGFGAFLDTTPRAEFMMPWLLAYTAIVENLVDTMLCTDTSQAVLWQNVDPEVLKAYNAKLKIVRGKRRNNERIDPEDEGQRLHVTAREPDKPAHAEVVNFRAFPTDFDPIKTMDALQSDIALGLGLNPRRGSASSQSERFGNASQAAMLNSDEPGVRAVEHSLLDFVSGVLLGGIPLRADFMAGNSPKNYAVVAKDQVVAQTLSQLKDILSSDQQMAYLVRQNVLMPAEAGITSSRTGDGTTKSFPPSHLIQRGWASLRWPDGMPIVYEPGIWLDPNVGIKALPEKKQNLLPSGDTFVGFNADDCAANAMSRYDAWISNELPHVVGTRGFNRHGLEEEVDDLAIELWGMMVNCLKSHIGNVRTQRVLWVLEALRLSWYDAIGSARLRQGNMTKPQHNLFDELWAIQGMLLTGRAQPAQAAQIASHYSSYINRYFNALRSAFYASKIEPATEENPQGGELSQGPVKWVRNAQESCRDCIAFEGEYSSVKALLKRTGGLLPGDPRLTCSGNCKCNLAGA